MVVAVVVILAVNLSMEGWRGTFSEDHISVFFLFFFPG